MLVAGLLLAALAAHRSGGGSVAGLQARSEVDGRVYVYVNGELRSVSKVHSFSEKAAPILAAAMFPTSKQREWNVTLKGSTVTFIGGSRFSTLWRRGGRYVSPAWGVMMCAGEGDAWSYPLLTPAIMNVYALTGGGSLKAVVRLSPPAVAVNSTGVYVFYGATVAVGWQPDYGDFDVVLKVEVYRPHTACPEWTIEPLFVEQYWYRGWPKDGEIKVRPGEALTLLYAFEFGEPYTANWGKLFAAWLHNEPFTAYEMTATDGSAVTVNTTWVIEWQGWVPIDGGATRETNFTLGMVPELTYVVVGDGQAQFSPFAYRVAHEIARAEPAVQVVGKTVKLSARFVFDRDVNVTETAVYVELGGGKEVMILYRVMPQPVTVRAGQPFVVGFEVRLP